jgi:hypothetical protein
MGLNGLHLNHDGLMLGDDVVMDFLAALTRNSSGGIW